MAVTRQSVDAVWAALSHPARRTIVDRLRDGPALTGDLVDELAIDGMSRFTTQRHLKVLRDAGLVVVEEDGRTRRNHLNGAALYDATIGWLSPPSRATAQRLTALRDQLASPPDGTASTHREDAITVSDFNHFCVHQQIDVAAPRDRAYNAVTGDVTAWWGSPYLLIERAGTRIEVAPTLGAQVVESNGDERRTWGTVTAVEPGRTIGWTGSMGMGALAHGTIELRLDDNDDGTTRITLTHEAFGVIDNATTASYDYGWADLLHRIRLHLDGEDFGVSGHNRTPDGFEHAPTA